MGLLTSFFGTTLYVQLAPDCLSVRNPGSGAAFSEPPEVAIVQGARLRMAGIGHAARLRAAEASAASGASVQIVNPFGHPRSLVSDFTVAVQLLKAVFLRLRGTSLLSVAPRVVMHPLGEPAGGLTQVEIRALHEMALSAGAGVAKVWQGRVLTDPELLSGVFPPDGRLLS